MVDAFQYYSDSVIAPARKLMDVTPSDTTDLPVIPKGLWVVVPGTVKAVAVDDDSDAGKNLGNLPAGTVIPVRIRRVLQTGTTATVVALY